MSYLLLINKSILKIYRILFILLISISFFSCQKEKNNDSVSATTKVTIREAGNQLLLKNQDSTSLILPVLELQSSVYKLEFNQPLTFEPNQLVAAINSSFQKTSLPKNYRVEVLQCRDNEVAYSYEIHTEKERTLIPCAGRLLPNGCYTIEITFLDKVESSSGYIWLLSLLGVGLLIFVIKLILNKKKRKDNIIELENATADFEKLGVFQFYPEQNKLVKAATEISLSKKECEILAIFVANPNQIIKRDELTKRVWEDNGVIVGRSLDTYISKLRKKLKDDDSIKLTNVHGVGYKLEM
ncbi:winged helix-turn-helix domain-containing protein [Lacinutrix sp. Bg11-31]|uniref:winged helix-turn-helix domain-containing protein n=1 Tax=Lacinutrix sp. Bg11-31 TaxID=2057808 RepID=UPI001E3E0FE5|nr:winged helix-turn-helix domain-containing protein [Lacinutrix sp. Bg11-31]